MTFLQQIRSAKAGILHQRPYQREKAATVQSVKAKTSRSLWRLAQKGQTSAIHIEEGLFNANIVDILERYEAVKYKRIVLTI